jgi:hypothetical protein
MSNFQTKVKKHLEKEGYKVLKIIKLSENGYPDLYAFKKGFTDVWVEIKEASDTLKPLQKIRIDQLNSWGKIALCLKDGKGVIYGNNTLKLWENL